MSKFVSHIHTKYSFDCKTEISEIIKRCNEIKAKYILISDHDVYGLTNEDEKLFENSNIKLFKGIEFTTSEKIHIIGVSDNIKNLEKPMFHYKSIDLVNEIKSIGGHVIIPHPSHKTGLFGNNLEKKKIDQILIKSDYIEKYSHKHGRCRSNSQLPIICGDDAHTALEIGNCYNKISNGVLSNLSDNLYRPKKTPKYYYRRFFYNTLNSKFYKKNKNKLILKTIIKYVKIFKR